MKRSGLFVIALALGLASCALHPRTGTPDPSRPVVSVVDGRIQIDQQVLEFRERGKKPIVWTLQGAGVNFPADGIEVEAKGRDEVQCPGQAGGRSYSCTNLHTKAGYYKYTIRVVDAAGNRIELDPFIHNP